MSYYLKKLATCRSPICYVWINFALREQIDNCPKKEYNKNLPKLQNRSGECLLSLFGHSNTGAVGK